MKPMHAVEKSMTMKFFALMSILTMVINVSAAVAVHAEGPTADVTTGRSVSGSKIARNDTVTVNYEVLPQPVPKDLINPPQEKEIVLVIDTSGSMAWDVYGKTTSWEHLKRISIAKNAANNFLTNLSQAGNVKVSLISYSNTAGIKKELTADLNAVKNGISKLNANGGTNIGDGLRRAFYELMKGRGTACQNIILLTDGEPTYHSLDEKQEFFMSDGAATTFKGGGSYATPKDKEYCYQVIDNLINTQDIKSYMVAFSYGSNQNILEELAVRAGGSYKAAMDADALNDVYEEISHEIISDFSLPNVVFDEVLPEGLQVLSASEPDKFSISGQTVRGNLGTICYNYNERTDQYEAAPIGFSLTLKGVTAGEYVLGENNSSKLSYEGINRETAVRYFPEAQVKVVNFGMPALEVVSVVKTGETAKVGLLVTLPEYADYAQIRDSDGLPVEGLDNIKSGGTYYIDGLSIYKTHKVRLWATSQFGETNETSLITIFDAVDIN